MKRSIRIVGSVIGLVVIVLLAAVILAAVNGGARPAGSPQGTVPVTVYATPGSTKADASASAPAKTVQAATSKELQGSTGLLFYAVREGVNTADNRVSRLTAYRLTLGQRASAQNAPMKVNNTAAWPWEAMIPSPDVNRVIIAVEFGHAIFNLDDGTGIPLIKNAPGPSGVFFNWHPDSRQILLRADENYPDTGLWLLDPDTGKHITLHEERPSPSVQAGAVSPDGKRVIYSIPTLGLWMVNTDGTDNHPVVTATQAIVLLWSPDGRKIAAASTMGLIVFAPDGSDLRVLSSKIVDPFLLRPVWAPDSTRIAYIAVDAPELLRDKRSSANDWYVNVFYGHNIHIVDANTGQDHALLTESGNLDPTWSPDSTQIAFAAMRDDKSDIWIVNADGTEPYQVTHTLEQQLVRYPMWRRSQ